MTTIDIKGRTFKLEGPTPFGTFLLTGPKGATFITAERWIGDHDTLKVIAWNGSMLAIKGNTVFLSRADLMATVEKENR